MNQGFIKVAAGTPQVTVADCKANTRAILEVIREMETRACKADGTAGALHHRLYLPGSFPSEKTAGQCMGEPSDYCRGDCGCGCADLCGTSYADERQALQCGSSIEPRKYSWDLYLRLIFQTIMNSMSRDTLLPGQDVWTDVTVGEESVPFASNLIFSCEGLPELTVGAEICEDLWVPLPPSVNLAQGGAHIIVNLSASDEMVGKDSYRRDLVKGQSARLVCGYIYATAGEGESSQDLVFGGQNLIAENGTMLAEAKRFQNTVIYGEIDVQRLADERRRLSTYPASDDADCQIVPFDVEVEETSLTRKFAPYPFVPSVKEERDMRCEEILNIQAMGLKKRMSHIHCQKAMVGLSGGLDSTLALLVIARSFPADGTAI